MNLCIEFFSLVKSGKLSCAIFRALILAIISFFNHPLFASKKNLYTNQSQIYRIKSEKKALASHQHVIIIEIEFYNASFALVFDHFFFFFGLIDRKKNWIAILYHISYMRRGRLDKVFRHLICTYNSMHHQND